MKLYYRKTFLKTERFPSSYKNFYVINTIPSRKNFPTCFV